MIRLQKVLAQAGVASRREAEKMILNGRIKVDGKVIKELGTKVDPEKNDIEVDDRSISKSEKKVYYLLNKPKGCVTTMKDPRGRLTVNDLLKDIDERVYPVGRLDYDTTGVLIITNDGELANALAHPKKEIDKYYHALVQGVPSNEALKRLREGVQLEDGKTAPAKIRVLEIKGNKSWLEIIIHEGKNRQVKRMCEAISHKVLRLKRTRFGPLEVNDLASGKIRALKDGEIEALKKAIE
ncbi:MAG: rRNA pseudouridine synthase [Proteobacteria bacterium]|nr:rRNA pseudouridine synthase [Pseudomonadota bacterium]